VNETVSLKCLNPQGVFEVEEPAVPAPRVDSLEGKTIGVFWDGKAGGDNFCIAVEELLNKRFPTAKTIRLGLSDVESAEKAKEEVDTFICAIADSGAAGWIWAQEVMALEKRGKPGVFVITGVADWNARISAKDNGMPSLRIVCIPSIHYFPNRRNVEEVRPAAELAIDNIIEALTKPLTEEEKNPKRGSEQEAPASVEVKAGSYNSAVKQFNQFYLDNHWGDGLPLIPPTEEAVKKMLTGTSRSPDEVIGPVPFRRGIATIRNIAINAVMAGAKPEYLPVIIAAVEGLADQQYSVPHYKIDAFSHMVSSEGGFNLMIMVSGPIGAEIKMNHGVGLLAHCHRPNNTIGRAVQLCIINIGHTWPGEVDMALIGRSSSHIYYTFAENLEESPWESFNEGMGFKKEDSYVTVATVGGMSSLYGGGVVAPWRIEPILESIVADVARGRHVFAGFKVGQISAHLPQRVIVLHPEMVIFLKRIGFETKQSLKDYLYEKTKVPYEDLTNEEMQGIRDRLEMIPGGLYYHKNAFPDNFKPIIKESLKPGGKVPVINPDDIHIVVSGTVPGYSIGWTYSREAHHTKLVKGATLTKSGR
jgi:hypothetical protein